MCTGNICRSPLAAQLLEADLERDAFEIDSAGVGALEGAPMPDPAKDIAAGLGLTAYREHQGKQLVAGEVARADLVMAMERDHRRAIVELHPGAVRYTFTLTEFAHIASNIPKTDLVEMVHRAGDPERGALDAVTRLRGVIPPLENPADMDIEDPYRRSIEVYERSSLVIVDAINTIVEYFTYAASLRSS
ncbi:arsenate reductase/protein-tyrosine-phosphatase family protein [Yaniella halotolerans]|uniref:arsenate reductase/protein-tyrosine-phosphatase family protein n=1 Tax=Yaniella halotolerans TaxID=225453 RepID=UPI001FE0240F|nr:low molecular weight phosphatase family protein [Yaniella halotolerans]